MKSRSAEKIKLTSIDELLGVVNEESAMEIEINRIHSFEDHPFKVMDDEKMDELVKSIRTNGVLVPVLLRPDGRNGYEMVSGHRRMHASQLLGFETIPAIVREMSRDDAVIAMVDANIQREELLPSEKAFAYKMKLGAMKRQGIRNDLTSGQNGQKLTGNVSRDILAEQVGESSKQIQRYIRLTELIPDLLEMVDSKKLNFTTAVDISYIDKQVQCWLYEYICDNGFIKPNQIAELRKYIGQGNMTQPLMISILNSAIPIKAPTKKVTFTEKKLTKYFPEHYSANDMERVQKNQYRTIETSYTYDKDNRETSAQTKEKTYSTVYDPLGRVTNRTWNTTMPFTSVYTYQAGINGSKSAQVEKISNGGVETSYTYDANENITSIISDDMMITYAYDELNRLVREDNSETDITILYVYDLGGNITEKRIYSYQPTVATNELETETLEDIIPYAYDTVWKDQLISYDGSSITYDALGNPLNYLGMSLVWENVRELGSITKNGVTYEYRYNKDGMRNRKYLTDGMISYQNEESLIVGEQKVITSSNNVAYELEFTYDSSGNILSMIYNGTEYYYVKNLQGDIISMIDGTGATVVTYKYDSWGKVLEISGSNQTLGQLNPFRYRGYYYDSETGFYYVSSRYYDPEVGRFISADTTDILGVDSDLYDKNLYAYCDNNPVMRKDAGGEFWTIASGAVIGAVISAGIEFGMQLATGGKIDVINIGLAALGGAAGGALAATGLGYKGQAIGNAIISGVSEAISQVRSGNRDLGSIALNAGKMAAVGAASVAIGGKGIKVKGKAYRNSLNNLNSVKGNVSKAISNPKGYRHQINRAIKTHQTTTRAAVKSTTKSFAKASFFSNFVGRVKSFFGW